MSDHPDDGVSDGGTAISETELVVKAYAKVLETKPETIVSDTSLPFPKQAIKEALKAEDLVVCELSGRKVDGATAAVRLADRSSGKPPLVLHGAE